MFSLAPPAGAPNDVFPPKYFESTFRLPRVVAVIVGNFESFRNYKGLRIIFPKSLDTIYPFSKVSKR